MTGLDILDDFDVLALSKIFTNEAKRRNSRGNVATGTHHGEVAIGANRLTGIIEYTLTVGEDYTVPGSDSLVMTRLALLLLERRKARLKKQDKALHVEELLERSLTIDCETHPIKGELKKARDNYIGSLKPKARKGAVKAAIVQGGERHV